MSEGEAPAPDWHPLRDELERNTKATLVSPLVELKRGGAEQIDVVAEEWAALCEEGFSPDPFHRPEWIQAYLRSFAPKAELWLLMARSQGKLRAVLHLVKERAFLCGLPARRLRGAANVHCCRFEAARSPGPEGAAAIRAIWRFLSAKPGWDLLDIQHAVEGGAICGLVHTAREQGFAAFAIPSWKSLYMQREPGSHEPGPWTLPYLPRFRSNLRRCTRHIETHGPLRLSSYHQADPVALQRFYALEASGWKGRTCTAINSRPETRNFYDSIVPAAGRAGYLAIDLLESGNDLIAASLGLLHHGRYYVLKSAYNELFRRHAPGHLIVQAILEDSLLRGIHIFDFNGPAEWDERRWASLEQSHCRCYIFQRGFLGWLLHFVGVDVRQRLKSWLALQRHAPPSRSSVPKHRFTA